MKKIIKIESLPFFAYLLLTALSVVSAAASCRLESGRFTVLTGNYTPPVLESFSLIGEQTAIMCFSRRVNFSILEYACFDGTSGEPVYQPVTAENVYASEQPDDRAESKVLYRLRFPEPTIVGSTYLLCGTVKDAGGSTLGFSLDFCGYNARVPRVLLSEVSPVHSYAKDTKKSKAEFVELYVLEDGNVGGMLIQSAYDGVITDFTLPAAEVRAGDYVTVHLRVLGEKAISEVGEDIGLSTTVYSSPLARDLWDEQVPPDKTRLGADDVLLVRERAGGVLVDALPYSRSEKNIWPKDLMADYAAEACESGIWISGAATEQALCSDGVTPVRTLSRLNVQSLAESFIPGEKTPFAAASTDWKVLSGKNGEKASPGRANVFDQSRMLQN